MPFKASFPCPYQSHDGQRYNPHCKDDVRDKNRKVKNTDPSLTEEGPGTGEVVVGEIGNQKQNRGGEGPQHTGLMQIHLLLSNENITQNQQHATGTIEASVQGRQVQDRNQLNYHPG